MLEYLADVPAGIGNMPLPPVSDVIGTMWGFMGPWQPYIVLIFGITLALGLVSFVFGVMRG